MGAPSEAMPTRGGGAAREASVSVVSRGRAIRCVGIKEFPVAYSNMWLTLLIAFGSLFSHSSSKRNPKVIWGSDVPIKDAGPQPPFLANDLEVIL